jgi:hypothetical protein
VRRSWHLRNVIEGYKCQADEEEDVRRYGIILRKGEDAVN